MRLPKGSKARRLLRLGFVREVVRRTKNEALSVRHDVQWHCDLVLVSLALDPAGDGLVQEDEQRHADCDCGEHVGRVGVEWLEPGVVFERWYIVVGHGETLV